MKRIKGGETVKAYATTMSIYPNGDRIIRKSPMSYTHIAGDTGITHELENFIWPEIPDLTQKGWEPATDVVVRCLNHILDQDPDTMKGLLEKRVPTTPNIYTDDIVIHKNDDGYFIGMLEILNSIIGPIADGPKKGQQAIVALYDCTGALRKFSKNDL